MRSHRPDARVQAGRDGWERRRRHALSLGSGAQSESPGLGPRQPVLAALGVALEQAELHERGGVAVGGRGAHAGVVGEFDDPPRAAVGAEAGEQREPPQ